MSTSNMAASWRQANDVIAPGWDRQTLHDVLRYTISETKVVSLIQYGLLQLT